MNKKKYYFSLKKKITISKCLFTMKNEKKICSSVMFTYLCQSIYALVNVNEIDASNY